MFRVSQHPSSEVLKTVTAASGTGHNTGPATSFQRGHVGTKSKGRNTGPATSFQRGQVGTKSTGHNIGPATSFQLGQVGTKFSPDLATLEGSSWTDIMTCTGGCGYSF